MFIFFVGIVELSGLYTCLLHNLTTLLKIHPNWIAVNMADRSLLGDQVDLFVIQSAVIEQAQYFSVLSFLEFDPFCAILVLTLGAAGSFYVHLGE